MQCSAVQGGVGWRIGTERNGTVGWVGWGWGWSVMFSLGLAYLSVAATFSIRFVSHFIQRRSTDNQKYSESFTPVKLTFWCYTDLATLSYDRKAERRVCWAGFGLVLEEEAFILLVRLRLVNTEGR